MIIVYTTFPNKQKAIEVCKKLLEERLIACFNSFEISSGYWWQNKIVDDTEYSVILKTIDLLPTLKYGDSSCGMLAY